MNLNKYALCFMLSFEEDKTKQKPQLGNPEEFGGNFKSGPLRIGVGIKAL